MDGSFAVIQILCMGDYNQAERGKQNQPGTCVPGRSIQRRENACLEEAGFSEEGGETILWIDLL
jgi:hypothetical protein